MDRLFELPSPKSLHHVAPSDDAAQNWAVVASLIQTCRLHGVDPQAYLTDILTRLVNLWPNSRIEELLPWQWRPNAA